jgi:hypothetical protein
MAQEGVPIREGGLPLTWVGTDEVPIQFVNQMIAQIDDAGDIIITMGQMTPPAIMGATEEERRRQVERIAYVPVRPIARFSLPRRRVDQIIASLQGIAQMSDLRKAELGTLEEGAQP